MLMKRLWNELGLRGKLLFAMSAMVVPIFIIMATYSFIHSKTLYESQMERELALENEIVSKDINELIAQIGEIAKQMGSLESIQSFVETNTRREMVQNSPDYDQLELLLTRVNNEHDQVGLVWIAMVEPNLYIADGRFVSDEDFDLNVRPWVRNAEASSGVTYSDVYLDYSTGDFTVSVIHPIESNGKRIGYFGMDVYLDTIPALISPKESESRKFILLSSKNQVMYDVESMWSKFEEVQFSGNEAKLVETNIGDYYVNVREVNDTGWRIVSFAKDELVSKQLWDFLKIIGLVWFVTGVMILVALSIVLRYMLKDLPTIVRHVKEMEQGNLVMKMNISRKDEVGKIAQSIDQMGNRLHFQIKELDYQAKFDQLTSLPNRNSIQRELTKWINDLHDSNEVIAVTFMDLDNFKQINDSEGHAFGDSLLIQVAHRIQSLLPKNSYFGRFGGDEFIILLREKSKDITHIDMTLKQIHESLQKAVYLQDHTIYVTASMGVSHYPANARTNEQLIAYADTALYKAKELGRNRIMFYNLEMKKDFEKQIIIEQGLRDAIYKEQFTLHYQPQFDILTGRTSSLEALIRWTHPELGMISPDEFIPIAESTGRIQEIGDWVMETAIQKISDLNKEFPTINRMAINVSALQLREPLFLIRLKELLEAYEVSPKLIELEITESLLVDGGDDMLSKLKELSLMGISIALDDFGTGYSSLNYLRILPINRVKIDKSFISKVEVDTRLVTIVRSIIDLSHNLGFDIVAEGVETVEQLNLLVEWNVDTIQGYYFSRPLNSLALEEFLRNESNVN
jgi:diguanylate cyclase (GGDEF)-like protein